MNITKEGEDLTPENLEKLLNELKLINQTIDKLENKKVNLLHRIHKLKIANQIR